MKHIVDEKDGITRRIMTTETSEKITFAVDYTYWGEIIKKDDNGQLQIIFKILTSRTSKIRLPR